MKVDLKCFSSLVNPDTCDHKGSTAYELSDGQTVEDLAGIAGIDRENIKLVFVNGQIVELNEALSDGDQVGLAPVTGGM
jgi:sulfur carrier protein ThiS